jgi:hypothetical protein
MDELARRYLLLCLRLERLTPGFVDSYVGPMELQEIALGEPMPLPAEIHDEALALRALTDTLDTVDESARWRHAWFEGQLRAISALARMAGGEEIGFLDLVEQLFGLTVQPTPELTLAHARARLDEVLPPGGSLADRRDTLRRSLQVPPERAVAAVASSAERFRSVTRRDFEMPDEEGIQWEEARDVAWGAYACFLGSGRTRIEINVDLPMEVSGAAFLASHEAYPGHHAEHVIKERTLIRDRGLGEATMRTMNTPEAVISEGLADVAREVVMADWELADELRTIGQSVGVDGDWQAAVVARTAYNQLQAATGNAAILLYRDGRSEDDVRGYLRDVGAVPANRIDHSMRILRDPVQWTYSFTYSEGVRLIRPWLELQGQTNGFARLLSEQLSPAVLLAETAAADAAVGSPA